MEEAIRGGSGSSMDVPASRRVECVLLQVFEKVLGFAEHMRMLRRHRREQGPAEPERLIAGSRTS